MLRARTPKSAPRPSVLNTFGFQRCFAPQLRAISQFLNYQKCLGAEVLLQFWLRNAFCTTTACTFWAAQLPKVLRGVFNILAVWLSNVLCTRTARAFSTFQSAKAARSWDSTSEFASRHSGMQFLISHAATWLRTRTFASLIFNPPEPQNIGKTRCFATFLPFRAPRFSFYWLFLF